MVAEQIEAGQRLETWEIEARRNFALGFAHTLVVFSKRKPLGAFGASLLFLLVIGAIFGPGLDLGIVKVPGIARYHYQEYELGRDVLQGPSADHWMGTDQLGRDLFSRLLYGSRLSFLIGGSVFLISSTMSTFFTIVSSYYIRSVDLLLNRVIEIIDFLPDLILLIALFSIYGATPVTLILTLGILGGFNTGRVLRSVIIGLRGQPFIEAAKSLGASDMRIIWRHIFPNVAYLIIVGATGTLATAILIESGLAILGFGINPSYPSLGNLLNGSRQYLRIAPWLAISPGIVIFMLLLGSRLLGDALRDVLDPRLRGTR